MRSGSATPRRSRGCGAGAFVAGAWVGGAWVADAWVAGARVAGARVVGVGGGVVGADVDAAATTVCVVGWRGAGATVLGVGVGVDVDAGVDGATTLGLIDVTAVDDVVATVAASRAPARSTGCCTWRTSAADLGDADVRAGASDLARETPTTSRAPPTTAALVSAAARIRPKLMEPVCQLWQK